MSFATSRVFNGCKALLAPAKSAAAATKSSGAKPAARKAAPAKPKTPKPKSDKPTQPTGILKVTPLSPVLRDFVGVPEASRTDVVKQIWVHIKQKNLQNPENKREILCDEKLKTIFDGREKVGFLEIGKLLTRHFVKSS